MFEETQSWGQKETRVLQPLQGNENIVNWNCFADKISHSFSNNEKVNRPMRQRNPSIVQNLEIKTGWTEEDEEELYRLHDEIGNKWAVIAHLMPGRTDNCVKNHFYSKLRKAMRKLNRYIHDFYRREFKEIKINAIYKIVEANEERHKPKTHIEQYISDYCQQLKNRLLRFSDGDDLEEYSEKSEVRKTISEIVEFNRNYKRQSKRKRKNSGNEDWNKPEYRKSKAKTEEDIFSSEEEDQNDEHMAIPVPNARLQPFTVMVRQPLPIIPVLRQSVSRMEMEKEEEEGVERILINAGMMEDHNLNMPMLGLKRDFSILSRLSGRPLSDNPLDNDAFFDESEAHHIKGFGFNPFESIKGDHHNDFL